MKRSKLLNILFVFMLIATVLFGTAQMVQGSGGPDDGGYIYDESSDPEGPVYNWEEISSTGTAVSLADNAMSSAITIPFAFHFYGVDYTQVYISSNGFLTFLPGQPNSNTTATIPTAATPNGMIAGYWADLNPAGSGASVTYQVNGSEPNRRFIIEFKDIPHTGILSTDKNTFEFKLFEGTNDIEVHYNTTSADGKVNIAGIENASGSIGLEYHNAKDPIASSTAVRYSIFTGVALRPKYEIKYGPAKTKLSYTQRIANWTGASTTFDLSKSGDIWDTHIIMGEKDFTTVPLANGESATFTVEVEIPEGAGPGDYSQVTLKATQTTGGTYEGTSTLITAVPRRGYALGYYNISDTDLITTILPMDTKFHNSLHEQIDISELGAFSTYGSMTPDGKQLWFVAAGDTKQAYAIDISELSAYYGQVYTGPYHALAAGSDASDITFTPDGKTAVITSYGDGKAEIVDTATYTITNTLTTGRNSLKTTIGACFPRKAFVTNYGANTVSVINLQTQKVTNISGFSNPMGVVVSPKKNWAYVANSANLPGAPSGTNGAIGVIDTLTDKLLYSWNVGGDGLAGIDISPDGNKLYVASNTNVIVVNADTGAVIKTIATPLDKLWDVSVFPKAMGDVAYVTTNDQNYDSMLAIDTANDTLIKQMLDLWNPVGLTLFPPSTECNVKPVASFTSTSVVGHVNEPITWTNTTTYGATSYTWDFGDGSPVSHVENPTHTYTAPGTYTVTLTAENAHGSSTTSGTVNFGPRAIFTPTAGVIHLGEPITFNNLSTGNEPLTYAWNFGDKTTSTDKSPTHTYTAAGDYTVTLKVTNSTYGSDTLTGKVDFAPVSAFTPKDNLIRPGESITFANGSTGTNSSANPLTFTWDFGDGETSTETNPTHTFNTGVDTTVTLTAHNGFGDDGVASTTVKFRPRAAFSPEKGSIHLGDPVQFTDQSVGPGPFTYAWDFGDGTTSTEQNPSHTYAAINDYTVKLTVTNANGSDTISGKVGFIPDTNFSQSAEVININDSVTFTNTTTGTATLTYQWDFGDGSAVSTDTSPIHKYTAAGNYTVTLTAKNGYGETQKTGAVHFYAVAGFKPTNSVILTGDTVQFNNLSTGSTPLTYTWDFGDETSASTETSPSHPYTIAGAYTVRLTVHNDYGPDSTATGTVLFAPTASFTPAQSVIQIGDSVTFTNNSVGTNTSTNPMTYTWDFGDGTPTSSDTNPVHQYTKAGLFQVKLTAHNGLGSDSTATGTVAFSTKAAFTPVNSTLHVGDTVTFTNQTTGSETITYLWDFGDGSEKSTEANPKHQYTTAGSYTVTLTAHNAYSQDSTATGTVVFAPTASFTPASSTIQTGDTINFANASVGTAPLSYSWDFGDSSPLSTEANPKHTYTSAGSYQVTLTVHNGYGDDSTATGTVVFSPKAIFTPTSSIIHVGDAVGFTNQSTGTGTLSYRWDFGDGSPVSTDTSPSHVYKTAGAYQVTLTAHNAYSPDSTATGTVVFAPTASFNPVDSIIQTGDTITFTNTSLGTDTTDHPLTYTWDFGDGTAASTEPSPKHAYTTAGSYKVTLTAHNGYGSDSVATGSVVFKPKAVFTPGSSIIKLGETINFDNQSTGTGPLTYAWDFGDGATSSVSDPSHQYTKAGSYKVTLTVTSAQYGSHSTTGTVNFQAVAAFSPTTSQIYVGDSIPFINNSTGTETISYTWDFGDGSSISTEKSPTHKYTTAGSYKVTLTAHNGYGENTTATGTVVFKPKAAFMPSANTIQVGDTIKFTNQSTGTEPMSYTWNFGDGTAESNEVSPSHQYTKADSYTVTLTVKNDLGTVVTTTQVNFKPTAVFTPTGTSSQPHVIKVGDTVQFANQSVGTGALAYTWDFGDGSEPLTETNPSHTYTIAGTYTVKLTARNDYGEHTANSTIVFKPTAAFTPEQTMLTLGDDLAITNLSVGTGPLTYAWDFGDGSPASSDATPSHIYTAAGDYTLHLTVSNAYGSDEYTGKVVFAPKAAFTASPMILRPNETVQFTSSVSGTGDLTLTWDFGDGSEASHEANPTHKFTQTGKFKVTLTVTGAYGDPAVYTLEINVSPHLFYLPVLMR